MISLQTGGDSNRCEPLGKSQRVKTQRVKTSENFAEENVFLQKIFQKISQKIEDIPFTGFWSISGYLRNLRRRLLSSEKFSEVFTLWVFTLKPFPDRKPRLKTSQLLNQGETKGQQLKGKIVS